MKFTISQDNMLLGLQRVQSVVERRTTMPILSNALIRADKNTLTISATDLEVGIQSILPASIEQPGSITIKAKSLLEIVRELSGTEISFETKDNHRLEIKARKSTFNLLGLPAEDFPEIPGFSSEQSLPFVRMNGTAMTAMLDKTLYAASNDEARYHLNGVYFETLTNEQRKRVFRMVATDAHRLALVDYPDALFDDSAWQMFENGVIVPRKGLNELRRLLSEDKEDFFAAIKDKMLFIKRDNIFLSMRLIDSKYADYRRIIPEAAEKAIELERDAFLASLKRVSLLASDKSRSLTIEVNPGVLQLSSHSPELGDASEEIPVEYDGDSQRMGFNSRYLIDAISTMEGDHVILELKGKQSPGVLRSTAGHNHTSVIMPMRI